MAPAHRQGEPAAGFNIITGKGVFSPMFQSYAINYVTIKKGSMFSGNCCQIQIIVIGSAGPFYSV